MKIIDYFDSERQPHWLEAIRNSDWQAGTFLHELLSKGTFFEAVGPGAKVLLLVDGDELISYCTYAPKDDIQPTELMPWIGFVYTFPKYRGHRYAGLLFEEVERLAKKEGIPEVYISTKHSGLYERYGCEYLTQMKDIHGSWSKLYVKKIL